MRTTLANERELLWALRQGDDDVRCEARLLAVGIEGRIVYSDPWPDTAPRA